MATSAQIAANRDNAQLSTGPRTEQGKAAVAQNHTTHGLAGRYVVLPDEDPAQYDHLLEELTAEHQPAGPTERFLVEQMAQAQWKLERIARMEARMFRRQLESGAAADAAAAWENDCAAANSLFKLSRYEATARRAWFKALAQLQSLRAPRRAEDANRVADDRLCQFIEHYINSPLPGARPAAAPPENENHGSKPISSPSLRPARRVFMDAAGKVLDRNLATRL